MRLRVAKADQDSPRFSLLKQPLASAMQNNEGFPTLFAAHFHVLPPQLSADSGAESLGNSLFSRKSRRQERRRNTVGQAITDFVRVQNPIEKPFPKALVRRPDPLDLDDVDPNSENHS